MSNSSVGKDAPGKTSRTALTLRLTPVGIVWGMGFALALIAGWGTGKFAPESSVGSWFATPIRLLLASAGLWLVFTLIAVISAKLGHPISRKD